MSYFKKQLGKKPEVWSRQKLESYKSVLRAMGRTERQIQRELKEQIRAVEEHEDQERK